MDQLIGQVGIGGIFVLVLIRVVVDAVEKLRDPKRKESASLDDSSALAAVHALAQELRAVMEILREMQRVQERCAAWHFDSSGLPRWLEFKKITDTLQRIETLCRARIEPQVDED
jgi:hypothetical protein